MITNPLPRMEFLATRGTHQDRTSYLISRIPALALPSACPACTADVLRGRQVALAAVVMHLNDNHCWGRVRIADWLDTLDLDLDVYDRPVWGLSEWVEPL